MKLICKQLDENILEKTANKWELLCSDSDEFTIKYQNTFDLAKNHIDYNNNENSQTLFYGFLKKPI